jgi:hypothetical protein
VPGFERPNDGLSRFDQCTDENRRNGFLSDLWLFGASNWRSRRGSARKLSEGAAKGRREVEKWNPSFICDARRSAWQGTHRNHLCTRLPAPVSVDATDPSGS